MVNQLYRVTTSGCGIFYVVGTSFDNAAKTVEDELDEQNYGYSGDRRITRVEPICQQVFMSNGKRALYGDDDTNHLIIADGVGSEQMERRCARLEEENCKLKNELEKANANIQELRDASNDGTAIPTPEEIKSVHAAAGVMEQVNEHTDAKNLYTLWEKLKKQHQE